MGTAASYWSTQKIGQGSQALRYVVLHTEKTVLSNNTSPQGTSKTQQAFLTAFEDEGRMCQVRCFVLVSELSFLPALLLEQEG